MKVSRSFYGFMCFARRFLDRFTAQVTSPKLKFWMSQLELPELQEETPLLKSTKTGEKDEGIFEVNQSNPKGPKSIF